MGGGGVRTARCVCGDSASCEAGGDGRVMGGHKPSCDCRDGVLLGGGGGGRLWPLPTQLGGHAMIGPARYMSARPLASARSCAAEGGRYDTRGCAHSRATRTTLSSPCKKAM
jgi:hypothetical protein